MELSKESAEGLRGRIAICKLAIELIEGTVDDPRQPEALAEYRGQLARLEARLAALAEGEQSKGINPLVGLGAEQGDPIEGEMAAAGGGALAEKAAMEMGGSPLRDVAVRGQDIVIGLQTARLFSKG
jgi:hypothetical protein